LASIADNKKAVDEAIGTLDALIYRAEGKTLLEKIKTAKTLFRRLSSNKNGHPQRYHAQV
jgi:hypothetical protein